MSIEVGALLENAIFRFHLQNSGVKKKNLKDPKNSLKCSCSFTGNNKLRDKKASTIGSQCPCFL